nr:melanophilin-like [Lytechinus pictus]
MPNHSPIGSKGARRRILSADMLHGGTVGSRPARWNGKNLQKYVYEEAQKRMVLSRQQQFNEKHCICCFSSFGFILNRKIQCQVCRFFICKNCRAKSEKKEDILCIACVQQQELQVRACEWFYAQIRAKFRRFGSAKVVRSLYKRDKERGSGSEDEDSQNSDSGVGRQRSPDSLGSSFDLSAFMHGPRNDQETNTGKALPDCDIVLSCGPVVKSPSYEPQGMWFKSFHSIPPFQKNQTANI